eukprot:s5244_g2.t1
MLCVRNLSGRELLAAAPRASSSSYPPFWANHAFDSGSSCGDTVLDENATLKLPLELVATVCGYVEADAGEATYCQYFSDAPFARHGGLSGTTARLGSWCGKLTRSADKGELPQELLVVLLAFLDTPRYISGATPFCMDRSLLRLAYKVEDREWLVRYSAVHALPQVVDTGDARAIAVLIDMLGDKEHRVRSAVVESLSEVVMKYDRAVHKTLGSCLEDEDPLMRRMAAEALAVVSETGDEYVCLMLEAHLDDPDKAAQRAVRESSEPEGLVEQITNVITIIIITTTIIIIILVVAIVVVIVVVVVVLVVVVVVIVIGVVIIIHVFFCFCFSHSFLIFVIFTVILCIFIIVTIIMMIIIIIPIIRRYQHPYPAEAFGAWSDEACLTRLGREGVNRLRSAGKATRKSRA